MPFTGVYGKGGSGKTTIVVYFLIYFKRLLGFKKYVNFDLNLPNTEKIDSIKLFEIEETDEPILVIWDEAYTEGLDNRDSFTVENKIQSYLLFQARKSNISILSIAQLNMLDTRWRQLEDNSIYCFPRPIYDSNFEHYKGDFHYAYVANGRITKFTLKYKDALKVFPYFKTKEKILPKNFADMKRKALLKRPEEKKKEVDRLVKEIRKMNLKKFTHDTVKNALLDLEETDFTLEPYVYVRLRKTE